MLSSSFAYAKTVGVVAVFTGLLLLARKVVNAGSAASALLLAVVLAGRFGGTGPALVCAFVASVVYLFFFLPPVGFSATDPNDWMSVAVFLITGLVAGSLLAQMKRVVRQRDHFERLYWALYGESSKDKPDDHKTGDGHR